MGTHNICFYKVVDRNTQTLILRLQDSRLQNCLTVHLSLEKNKKTHLIVPLQTATHLRFKAFGTVVDPMTVVTVSVFIFLL